MTSITPGSTTRKRHTHTAEFLLPLLPVFFNTISFYPSFSPSLFSFCPPSLSTTNPAHLFSLSLSTRYQINARTELAVRYNDISPLENHHCAVAFQIFSQPDCNIFSNFDPEAFKQIRQVGLSWAFLSRGFTVTSYDQYP